MAKHAAPKSRIERVKALPWATMAQAGFVLGRRWRTLSAKERARLAALVRESRGRASNLSHKQQGELRKLVKKLDLKATSRELLIVVGRGRRKHKRRHRRSR